MPRRSPSSTPIWIGPISRDRGRRDTMPFLSCAQRPRAPDCRPRWRPALTSTVQADLPPVAPVLVTVPCQERSSQSTATASAAHTRSIRSSLRRPRRSTRADTETLSTESRFTTDRRGIGSSPVSSTTSLGRLRIVVVHGATGARRSLGMAGSRERMTTGRRPISDSAHHHTSPRAGRGVTIVPQPRGMKPDSPTHRVRREDGRHTSDRQHRSRRCDVIGATPPGLYREALHP